MSYIGRFGRNFPAAFPAPTLPISLRSSTCSGQVIFGIFSMKNSLTPKPKNSGRLMDKSATYPQAETPLPLKDDFVTLSTGGCAELPDAQTVGL